MGGCRCSFRNCTNSSDGRTHFFHYPVRDAARCDLWVTNARRPEFRNISKTQLKNKVICEHHFLKHCFMCASTADRLVHNAVPTVEGPNCGEEVHEYAPIAKEDVKFAIPKKPIIGPQENTDMNTSDVSSTTLTVSESPALGFTFFSEESEVKRTRTMQPYTEALTRKSTGMIDLLKRKVLQSSHHFKSGSQLHRRIIKTVTKTKPPEVTIAKPSPLKQQNEKAVEQRPVKRKASLRSEIVPDNVIVFPYEPNTKLPNTKLNTKPNTKPKTNTNESRVIETKAGSPTTIILNNDGAISTTTKEDCSRPAVSIQVHENIPIMFPPQPEPTPEPEPQFNLPDSILRLIEQNSREIVELKNLISQTQTPTSAIQPKKRKPVLRKSTYVKKLELYSNIVQYLSPQVARLVYTDLFKSKRH